MSTAVLQARLLLLAGGVVWTCVCVCECCVGSCCVFASVMPRLKLLSDREREGYEAGAAVVLFVEYAARRKTGYFFPTCSLLLVCCCGTSVCSISNTFYDMKFHSMFFFFFMDIFFVLLFRSPCLPRDASPLLRNFFLPILKLTRQSTKVSLSLYLTIKKRDAWCTKHACARVV